MKIPALRINMGTWKYYVSYLSFKQVSQMVKKVDNELHKSVTLQDLIQRSITKNLKDITEYILSQKERFFNSLVLAVYDGDPKWIEVELNFKEREYFEVGFLEFNGEEKIFPIDGQHRVEGIKKAIEKNPVLNDEKISVLFLGHRKTKEGMQRSRRLFTTLNRYAKPVTMDDIIALDEDDAVAIITRDLLETHLLFGDKKIIKSKQKSIPDIDKQAFTSIITLYQCNRELLKSFLKQNKDGHGSKSFKTYLKYRPDQKTLDNYREFTTNFWNTFSNELKCIRNYLADDSNMAAKRYRNRQTGGNLLFRPVGLLPFIQAIILIHNRTKINSKAIITRFNKINLEINKVPWNYVLWNPTENKMIMGSGEIVKHLLVFLFKPSILNQHELNKLQDSYAAKIAYNGNSKNVLRLIRKNK